MGTAFTITLYAPDAAQAAEGAEAAFKRIDELENILSDYQADSELNLLRGQPVGKPIRVSQDLFSVLKQAQRISQASMGAFDVTAGPFVRQWRLARKRKVLPTPAESTQARAAVGWRKLELDDRSRTVNMLVEGMQLDVGGIAKGYAADAALRLLMQRGLRRALVAASGDIAVGDPPPGQRAWRVAIGGMDEEVAGAGPHGGPDASRQDPTLSPTLSPEVSSSNQTTRVVFLRNAGISTSGDTEQFIEIEGVRHSHIVNPVTGLGLTNRIQATVVARNATTSDALATAICVLGPTRSRPMLRQFAGTSAVIAEETDAQVKITEWP